MTFIEKLESFQQQLIGVGQTAGACDLQNIIEEYKNAQEPVWEVKRDSIHILTGVPTSFDVSNLPDGTKLFTHPPLSDETVKVPEGYALVPIDPSESMLNAALNGTPYKDDNKELMLAAYKAMIDEAMKVES